MRKQYHTRTVGFDTHTWDVHRLVRLAKNQTSVAIPLESISELDENWWFQSERDHPTPRSLAKHMALVRDTDLQYPIILCEKGRLMDGMHRVVKAFLENKHTILAVRLAPMPEPDFINVDVEELDYPDEEV